MNQQSTKRNESREKTESACARVNIELTEGNVQSDNWNIEKNEQKEQRTNESKKNKNEFASE